MSIIEREYMLFEITEGKTKKGNHYSIEKFLQPKYKIAVVPTDTKLMCAINLYNGGVESKFNDTFPAYFLCLDSEERQAFEAKITNGTFEAPLPTFHACQLVLECREGRIESKIK